MFVALVPTAFVGHLRFVRKTFSNNLILSGDNCQGTELDGGCKRMFVYQTLPKMQAREGAGKILLPVYAKSAKRQFAY